MEFKIKWKSNLQIWKTSAWLCCKEWRGGRRGSGRFARPYPEDLVMRWLVWTEGSQVLFIRIMEEWPKGFSKAATLWQNHNTGLWSQDSIIGNKEYFSEFMVYWTMNSTIVSASHKSVPMYSLSIGEAPVCPGTVWDLTAVPAKGTVHKPWWCPSGVYSSVLHYPRAARQGSLPLDFIGWPFSLRIKQRITIVRETMLRASMGAGPVQFWCKNLSRGT
jgi:hypothetical protein